jgi:hypothetical protein
MIDFSMGKEFIPRCKEARAHEVGRDVNIIMGTPATYVIRGLINGRGLEKGQGNYGRVGVATFKRLRNLESH